jgi:hypothetical protein
MKKHREISLIKQVELAKTGKLRGLVHITLAHSNGNYDNVNKLTQQLGSMGAVRPRVT